VNDPEQLPLRVFYRIVWTNPPTIHDVQANPSLLTRPRVGNPEYLRLQTGISVFRTLAQARRTAIARPPWSGDGYIARIVIPDDAEFRIERTTKSRGHYTLWADSKAILSWIDAVEPVKIAEDFTHG